MVFFEYWPSAAREYFTPFFAALLFSWHVHTQEWYLYFMQHGDYVRLSLWGFVLASIVMVVFWLVMGCSKWIKFRLHNVHRKVNWYRWLFIACELVYLPLLFNISWSANCTFITKRNAIQMATCANEDEAMYWILKALIGYAFCLALGYNIVLVYLIQFNKISTQYHEQSVQKKEIEYSLGINNIWKTGKFYTFSSFKGGYMMMYHRILFNLLGALLCLCEVLFTKYSTIQYKMMAMTVLVILFTIHCFVARPYRSNTSNFVYLLGLTGLSQQTMFVYAVVQEY